ncbi:hypothetical protein [Pseudomonas sp.]|uniref:hypothetical protein n=1 Tax=Pseudomonas sp. TaxID=306 RepID=UPI0028A64596|nr:hypothetical protein [Pseudomonas sp.]
MSSKHMLAYDQQGRIVLVASGPVASVEQTMRLNTSLPLLQIPEPANAALSYVDKGRLLARPIGSAALAGSLLTGVTAGAVVVIEDVEYIADGSDIELEFSQPGAYSIKVSAWPCQDQEFIFENPA